MSVSAPGGKDELRKWNWGAFFWTWIWAAGHGLRGEAAIGFFVGLFVPLAPNIYFAVKGNRLAWEKGTYSSKEELRAKERRWAWAAAIFYGLIAIVILIALLTGGFE
jgi:hypothetical protein